MRNTAGSGEAGSCRTVPDSVLLKPLSNWYYVITFTFTFICVSRDFNFIVQENVQDVQAQWREVDTFN